MSVTVSTSTQIITFALTFPTTHSPPALASFSLLTFHAFPPRHWLERHGVEAFHLSRSLGRWCSCGRCLDRQQKLVKQNVVSFSRGNSPPRSPLVSLGRDVEWSRSVSPTMGWEAWERGLELDRVGRSRARPSSLWPSRNPRGRSTSCTLAPLRHLLASATRASADLQATPRGRDLAPGFS